jgi:integrase
MRLTTWLAGLELVDAQGAPVTVTPHQFRHTLGTRMINEDIPLEVIRRMLDHGSLADHVNDMSPTNNPSQLHEER